MQFTAIMLPARPDSTDLARTDENRFINNNNILWFISNNRLWFINDNNILRFITNDTLCKCSVDLST